MKRAGIRVAGIVQGVGFRPFIYRLAKSCQLTGFVRNDEQGVWIEAEGKSEDLKEFSQRIAVEAPAMAKITSCQETELNPCGDTEFLITKSIDGGHKAAYISPDIAICEDCRREIADPNNRRYGYAFTNCTNCGPRYSIIKDIPYDRPLTTMKDFQMCPFCRDEYEDPLDRRFHAQPNACGSCGPRYTLYDSQGKCFSGEDLLKKVRTLIRQGKILALKGIGGYHLVCDARCSEAVKTLRARKIREDKPFAVMGGSLQAVQRLCEVSEDEEKLLNSPSAPVVLLKKKAAFDLAEGTAPGNPYLGVMLPYAPVHCLLLETDDVWVMTSGNTSDEPIAYKDADAWERLAGIADYFLVHDREIYSRVDDSVARVFAGAPYLLRRSRGMAPTPIALEKKGASVLACGAEVKNTFCLTKGSEAFVSEHIGDLENQATLQSFSSAIEQYERLFEIRPELAVCDLHPEYLSTKYAKACGLPWVEVQHHHAHIASVLAEHHETEKVIGVAFDGTGYGEDGHLWGGEFMVADCRNYERVMHLAYMKLPGAAKAIQEPWRQALWLLYQRHGRELFQRPWDFWQGEELPKGWELLLQAAEKGLNTPLSSSAGRLFDTAAALLGIRMYNHYEGQAAIELERAAGGEKGGILPYTITGDILDLAPALQLLAERKKSQGSAALAADFHTTVADAICSALRQISRRTGIWKVALSGGVFQNMTLLEQVTAMLGNEYTVLLNRQVPPNDGGIALGQAAVAIERGR